jgi:orotidine-5'-phosphate decarboxylase
MTRADLYHQIKLKKSYLCVGLDPDLDKMPLHLQQDNDGIFKFCKEIIEHTQEFCVAYKPNLAFFECLGAEGWDILGRVIDLIPDNIFTIADAKRGDIGNTSRMYAKTYFDLFNFDAVTVAPYMGIDSVEPFLEFDDKWVILLGLTSNKGSQDFQMKKIGEDYLYQTVIKKAQDWGTPNNLMFVIGATHPDLITDVRDIAKDYFFLVPGVGAQGGDLNAISQNGLNDHCGLLINSSRGIIYASQEEDFGYKAGLKAKALQTIMTTYLS